MERTTAALAGFRGLKGQILLQAKKAQPITAKELSLAFRVSANAVRRHLKELEAEGLVEYGRERRGVGAPAFAYRLTPRGEALFPNRYEEALTALLANVEERAGRGEVDRLFADQFQARADHLKRELGGQSVELRLERLVRDLSDEGYMAEWSSENGAIRLAEHHCAIRAIAGRYPEICAAEKRFISEVLAAEVERRTHITEGSSTCEYTVSVAAPRQPGEHGAGAAKREQT